MEVHILPSIFPQAQMVIICASRYIHVQIPRKKYKSCRRDVHRYACPPLRASPSKIGTYNSGNQEQNGDDCSYGYFACTIVMNYVNLVH